VAICTSTDTHVDAMVAAADAGKAIFCEKPVSLDIAEVDRALAAVEAGGVALQIGFNRRWDPSHRAVAAAVRAGDVGEIHLCNITSRDPGPPPIDYLAGSALFGPNVWPEELPGFQNGHALRPSVGSELAQLHFSGFDHEQGAPDVSFQKQHFALVVGARVERLQEIAEFAAGEAFEDAQRPQKLGV